jgi:hypothetical protein
LDYKSHLREAEEEFLSTYVSSFDDFHGLAVYWQHLFHHVNTALNLILRDSGTSIAEMRGSDEFYVNSIYPTLATSEIGGNPELATSNIEVDKEHHRIEIRSPLAASEDEFGGDFCRTVQNYFPIVDTIEHLGPSLCVAVVGSLSTSLFGYFTDDSFSECEPESELLKSSALLVALNTSYALQSEPWFLEHCVSTNKVIWRGDLKWNVVSSYVDCLTYEE